MPRHSLDRSSYYKMYYEAKKDQIRNRYFEKKETRLREEEMFKPYGGEKNYYKNSLVESGFLFIK